MEENTKQLIIGFIGAILLLVFCFVYINFKGKK